ncbi:MAG: non-ribosomal peptide synthetase, partial [Chloroflexales bacterium]|nr:non-ribosomal peptide synthetase [Chloroflexales bacterium]
MRLWVDAGRLRCSAPQGVLTPELSDELRRRREELISALRAAQHAREADAAPLAPVSRGEALPLSFAQQRIWFLEQLSPGNTAHNLAGSLRLSGRLDPAALELAMSELIRRHEILRTTFVFAEGRPSQVIGAPRPFALPIIDLRPLSAPQREAEAERLCDEESKRPFDLERGPLVRLTLVQLDPIEHLLILSMHHIVSDGWSFDVFAQEISQLYRACAAGSPSPLPPHPVQYADFAVWQRRRLEGPVLAEQLAYWKGQLAGPLPTIDLPLDRPLPPVQTFSGARETLVLSEELTAAVRALGSAEDASLFMVLLAAFEVLLHRQTGQTDIVVGTPLAGRTRPETERLIGCFLNTLVLRTDLGDDPPFRELVARVRETALSAYAHQELPFERLVEELRPERDV